MHSDLRIFANADAIFGQITDCANPALLVWWEHMFETTPRIARPTLLIGSYTDQAQREEAASLLDELEELVDTLGLPVREKVLVFHRELHARFLLGSGKAQELADRVKSEELGALIFDHDLSPSQQRNWEELAGVPVLDRQKVILDIFAGRAQTREARLQIELAQHEYMLPRLTRAWGHLGGQGGGIGAKGEGESQLEQDRRRMWKSMDRLKRELEQVRSARATQRKDRQRTPVPNCAIVGYTNAGKSSLLRRLTGAEVLVEDKLFATLDTTTRKVALPSKKPLLLTDTVGFVRKLPHRLVEAFKATLEEAAKADFLLHLLDASAKEVMSFYTTTMRVLEELGAGDRPMLIVFNKIDKVEDESTLRALRTHFPDAHFISVHTGAGLDELLARMDDLAGPGSVTKTWCFPGEESARLAMVHRCGQVRDIQYEGSNTIVTATVPEKIAADLAQFLQVANSQPAPDREDSFLETTIAKPTK
jgi:GTPase